MSFYHKICFTTFKIQLQLSLSMYEYVAMLHPNLHKILSSSYKVNNYTIFPMILKIIFIKWILFSGRGYAWDAELVISDRFSPGHGQRGRLRPGADTGRVVGQIVIEI